jgi:lipopolysaccharide transport system ATP-binding protein
MHLRLAFAVAAHLEPEILLVDEVLAVGDLAFQKKCLGKMGDVATQGQTVVFVSHNMIAVQSLCKQAIWLDHGGIIQEGEANQVIASYLSAGNQSIAEQTWPDMASAPGNDKVRIHRVCVYPENGSPNDPITMDTPVIVEVEYWNLMPDRAIASRLHFYTEHMVVAFSSGPTDADDDLSLQSKPCGLYREVCKIPRNLLNSGSYRIWLLMIVDSSKSIFRLEDCVGFDVLDLSVRAGAWYGKEPGFFRPVLEWKTEKLYSLP